jgi:hypothetical protein
MFEHHDPQKLINHIIRNQERLMADITALTTAVTDNTTAVDAAVTKLQSGTGTPTQAEVDTLTSAVQSSVASLNAAVAAVPAA